MHPIPRSRPIGTLLTVLTAPMIVLFLGGCGSSQITPVDIAENELCARCRALIAEKQYAAEFVTKDGFVRKFDDISCMIQHTERVKRESIGAFFVMDYATQQWVKGEEARFVRSDKFKTPQDGGILAFKNHQQAQALAGQYQAELLALNDILK